MSLRQSLADTLRDKGNAALSKSSVSIVPAKPKTIAQTSGSPSIKTAAPMLSSGGTGMGKSKGSGMGAKNGIGFPKKASMATGASGIKGPTKLGKNIRGSMK